MKQVESSSFKDISRTVNAASTKISILKLSEYRVVSPIDTEKWQPRAGLEGPFKTNSGKIVYYDAREGKYYDPSTDMYIDNDEAHSMFSFRPDPLQ